MIYPIGYKVSMVTVISNRIIKNNRGYYNCLCDCEKTHMIRSDSFPRGERGKTISCGCYRFNRKEGEASFNVCYDRYKRNAKTRNIFFPLLKEQFRSLVIKNCFYCDLPPSNKSGHRENNGYFIYNGIDRIDNNKGYELTNLLPCCKLCNVAKNKHDLTKFIDWVKRISKNISKMEDLR